MHYDDYKRARDLSWRVLLDTNTQELPVKVSRICRAYGVTLRSYQSGEQIIRALGLAGQCAVCDGFTVRSGGHCYVFYNMAQTPGRVRFTIAHELGHVLLGHLGEGEHTIYNREPSPEDAPEEHAANIFASRLLAPACVRQLSGSSAVSRWSHGYAESAWQVRLFTAGTSGSGAVPAIHRPHYGRSELIVFFRSDCFSSTAQLGQRFGADWAGLFYDRTSAGGDDCFIIQPQSKAHQCLSSLVRPPIGSDQPRFGVRVGHIGLRWLKEQLLYRDPKRSRDIFKPFYVGR